MPRPERRGARDGQTGSVPARQSIGSGSDVGFVSAATAVGNPQAETGSRAFALGPLGPVTRRAQPR